MKRCFLLLLFVLLLTGCDPKFWKIQVWMWSENHKPLDFYGKIVDQYGRPVEGAKVIAGVSDGSLLSERDVGNQMDFINRYVKSQCGRLLASEKPDERRKGAVIAGSAGFKELTAHLKELLSDPAFNSGYSSDGYRYTGSYRKYFVREAAVKALRSLGEDVEGVKTRDDFTSAEDEAAVKAHTQPNTN